MVMAVPGRRMMETLMKTRNLDPYQRLAAGVVIQAFSDTREECRHSNEARDWFGSEHCLFWLTALLERNATEWQQFCQQVVEHDSID